MAKRVKTSKKVPKRTASKKTAKRQAGTKKVKAKTTKKAKKTTAKKRKAKAATKKGGTAKRTKSGATGRAPSKKVKKAATKTAKKTATPKRRIAKKAKAPARKVETTTAVRSHQPFELPGTQKKLPKTHLTAKQLREFKNLLVAKRHELAGDVEYLTSDAFERKGHGSGAQSSMPIHMADLGTDNWEQEFTLGLIENEQALIREIDEALARIDQKTYGICLATHKKISLSRLRAKPWAKYCIEYARAREEGRAF
jgi:RNA polymerase-binding protein DksA